MLIYKVLRAAERAAFERAGRTDGAPVDLADGFIHFSTGDQLAETQRRHFDGESELWILACESDGLGEALRWEPSRGGALFPHLHRPLERADVLWSRRLGDGTDGLA